MFALALFQRHPARFAVAAAFALLGGVSATVLLAIVDRALHDGVSQLLGLTFLGAAAARLLFGALARRQLLVLAADVLHELRLRLARRMAQAPLAELEGVGAQRLVAALTADVQELTKAVSAMAEVAAAIATVVGALAYLTHVSWRAGLVTLVMLAAGFWVWRQSDVRATQAMGRSMALRGRVFGLVDALVSGLREIKLHRGRRRAILDDELGPAVRDMHVANERAQHWYGVGETLSGLLVFAIAAAVLAATGTEGSSAIGLVMAVVYLQGPTGTMLYLLGQLSAASVLWKQMESLGLHEEPSASQSAAARPPFRSVELRGVTRRYESDEGGFELGPIDLELRPGQIVFVVGGNGSGKSTLAKLLLGLHPPRTGSILLNGAVVRDAERAAYREQFGAVFVEGHLFRSLWGVSPDALAAQGTKLLQDLDLSEKTRIEGRSFVHTALSSGQRKRLALVAALLEDRPAYLFDEWAAEQDPEHREHFYRKVLPSLRAKGKTLIVISHDDAYFDVADRVLRLERGKVVAGDPAEVPS